MAGGFFTCLKYTRGVHPHPKPDQAAVTACCASTLTHLRDCSVRGEGVEEGGCAALIQRASSLGSSCLV